ncbi:hypothetical protein KZA59_03445, partial [Streptococcus pyogenes]|nr:hypothetical protein [Streptococcus pyogenes]MBW3262622.1 hypothetical protein [Streptococcus pyogenes]
FSKLMSGHKRMKRKFSCVRREMIDRLTLQNNFLMVNCSLCEITAEKYEARQQVVIYSSNLCCLGENPLHESGFFKPLFPQKI